MTFRVAFDATAIPAQRLGAGLYIVELLAAVEDPDVDLHVFVNARDAAELAPVLPNVTLHKVRVDNRVLRIAWSHTLFSPRVRKLGPDVFHGPHYMLPPGLRCPGVVTFHDPTFFTLPHVHEPAKVAYFTRAARAGIARATRVIAPSEYSRFGAIDHAGAAPERVDVVPDGVDLDRYTPGDGTRADPYILFVGALEPRKDVPSLIAAYDELDDPPELVLCGPPAWGAEAVQDAIARARRKTIRLAGFVSEQEKVDLYRGATVFVYPSLAEGFGLPVLEAMACGAPVVTTTGSAPEEVADGAALLAPPGDVNALREAIANVLDDEDLAAGMRSRGIARARTFSWKAAAARTVSVWRTAADR